LHCRPQALWQPRQIVRTNFTLGPVTGSTAGPPLIQRAGFSLEPMQPPVAARAPRASAPRMNFLLEAYD